MSCGVCYTKSELFKPCRCSFKMCLSCLDKCDICPQCRRTYSFSTDWRLFEYFRYYFIFNNITKQKYYIEGIIIKTGINKIIAVTKKNNQKKITKSTFTCHDKGRFILNENEPDETFLKESYKYFLRLRRVNKKDRDFLHKSIFQETLPTIREEITSVMKNLKENKINSPKFAFGNNFETLSNENKKRKNRGTNIYNNFRGIKIHVSDESNRNSEVVVQRQLSSREINQNIIINRQNNVINRYSIDNDNSNLNQNQIISNPRQKRRRRKRFFRFLKNNRVAVIETQPTNENNSVTLESENSRNNVSSNKNNCIIC